MWIHQRDNKGTIKFNFVTLLGAQSQHQHLKCTYQILYPSSNTNNLEKWRCPSIWRVCAKRDKGNFGSELPIHKYAYNLTLWKLWDKTLYNTDEYKYTLPHCHTGYTLTHPHNLDITQHVIKDWQKIK